VSFFRDKKEIDPERTSIAKLRAGSDCGETKKEFETTIAQQQKETRALAASLKQQASQIQK
jgi:hypothetical protein